MLLWLKALHIVFVVTWFAGLFYLPRLFVYHLEAHDAESKLRFGKMENRLLVITHIGGGLALAFGIAVLLAWIRIDPSYLKQGWLHAKLLLVALLVAYHLYCMKLASVLQNGTFARGERWLRLFNEVPAVILIGAVILVVVKPF